MKIVRAAFDDVELVDYAGLLRCVPRQNLLYLIVQGEIWYDLPLTIRGLPGDIRRLYLPSAVMNQVYDTKKPRGQSLKNKYFVNVSMSQTPPPVGGERDRRATEVRRSQRARLTSYMVYGVTYLRKRVDPPSSKTLDPCATPSSGIVQGST